MQEKEVLSTPVFLPSCEISPRKRSIDHDAQPALGVPRCARPDDQRLRGSTG